jgi:hypothetical protein
MTQKAGTLENLRLTLHGVTSPFSCEGTFVPDKPVTLVFKDRTRFEVIRARSAYDQKNELMPLLDHCKPAPFGDGRKTRYDRSVRDAMQLNAEDGGFTVENFDPESAGILKAVQRGLVGHDADPISAELHAVNVYTEGGHFAPHKDTPRGNDTFGTLVVCLPSQFVKGTLVLNHRGIVQKFDWGGAIQAQKKTNQVHWAAFFGDVDHQIEKVWSGARVTLTYLLRRGSGSAPARDAAGGNVAPSVQEAWQELLADQGFLPDGGILGYPCSHLYHQDARFQQEQIPFNQQSMTMLKGRDHLVAVTGLQAGLNVTFHPYMFEDCADETWQLGRFPTRGEQSRLGRQMDSLGLKHILPIRASSEQEGGFGVTWLEPPPSSDKTSWRSEQHADSELPMAARLHSCEYCPWGYFGNEASDVDLYMYAALHIEIPLLGDGPRVAKKPLKRGAVKREPSTGKRQAKRDE